MLSLSIFDILIVLVYISGCIIVGFYRSKSIKDIKDYTIGPGRFHDIVIVSTVFATAISAGATIGTVEKIYVYGTFFAVTRIVAPFFWYIMIKVYAEHIDQFRGCLSVSDIMHKLYGETGRWITNIAAILLGIGAVATQAAAMGYMLNYFIGISYRDGLFISIAIMVVYSAMGGIRAVAFTDVFQMCVFIIAIPLACSVAYHDAGGYKAIVSSLPSNLVALEINSSNVVLFLSFLFYSFMPVAEGAYIQRFLMTSSKEQLIRSLYLVMFLSIPFMIVLCAIAFIIKAQAPDIEPNVAFIYFVANYMSVGIKGIVVAGILAVIMSSADSWLNYSGILCAHDIVKKIFRKISDKQELMIARISTFIIGFLSSFLALSEESVLSLSWIADNFWQPITLVPLAAGFLGFKTHFISFIVSTIFAVICTIISGNVVGSFAATSLVFGILGSAVGLFSAHYFLNYFKKLHS